MEDYVMKLWIDAIRPAPRGYVPAKSVDEAKEAILAYEEYIAGILDELDYYDLDYLSYDDDGIVYIDIGHNIDDDASKDDDYIHFLDWLEKTGRNYPIYIHSTNPVIRQRMQAIIQRNSWTEIQ